MTHAIVADGENRFRIQDDTGREILSAQPLDAA